MSGEDKGGDDSQCGKVHTLESEGSQWHREGPVIFLLKNLKFDPEDDFPGTQPNLPYRLENLAATYQNPLHQILSSGLHATGLVRTIYLNFGPRGFYELNPNWEPVVGQQAFERLLRELFQTGTIMDPRSNEVIWRKIDDFSSILCHLPANTRKIGCNLGADSQGSVNLQDYITNAPAEQIYFYVVGQVASQEMEEYVDDFVKVSEYDLVAEQCVARVIHAMETKWGIQ